jgi:MFS-type transporter involved in bile tolerance (Atg22 family)
MDVMAGEEALPLWRNRDYVLLWLGQVISSAGTTASGIAFPLLVLATTGSAIQAGAVGAVERVPYIVLCLPAGALVDRWDRKRVMIGCDLGRALALGSIPLAIWAGHLWLPQLYLAALVEGSLFVFFNLAETACLPHVVPRAQLPAVSAQSYISQSVASLIGPPLGGGLYAVSRALPFAADAVSYLASVVSLAFIQTRFQGERAAARRSLAAEIREGMSWLWGQPLIRAMALLTCGTWVAYGGLPLIMIVFAQREFAASPLAIGLVLGSSTAGSIIGAWVGPIVQRRLSFGQAILASCWLLPCIWLSAAVAPNLAALAATVLVVMIVDPIYDIVQYSYRLSLIPDELQGRVNSVFRLIAWSGWPLGIGLAGIFLETIGPRGAVLAVFGLGAAVALAATASATIRTARPLESPVA